MDAKHNRKKGRKMGAQETKIPPQDLSAERAVLGSVAIAQNADNPREIWDTVFTKLSAADFYDESHQVLFQTMKAILSRQDGIDLTILNDELRGIGKLEAIGGTDYLIKLCESVSSPVNANYHADIVREAARKRQYIILGNRLESMGYAAEVTSDQLDEILQGSADAFARQSMNGDTIPLSEIVSEDVEWLWPGRFALGAVSMIAGNGGSGKSSLTQYMGALVTSGDRCWPDGGNIPQIGSVLLVNGEDHISKVIRPRIERFGGNVDKISILKNDGFDLEQVHILHRIIKRMKDCRLVVIDPIGAFLGGNVDSHKLSDVRRILRPLETLAEDHGLAVILVNHLSKNAGAKADFRVSGSGAFVHAPRAVYLLEKDEDDPGRRLFLELKNNLGPDQQGLAFRFNADQRIVFEDGPVEHTAQSYYQQQEQRHAPARKEAREWLLEVLGGGPVLASEIRSQANSAGMNHNTLDAARRELGVRSERHGFGRGAKCYWYLPEHEGMTPETDAA